jgi:hypothetical protein
MKTQRKTASTRGNTKTAENKASGRVQGRNGKHFRALNSGVEMMNVTVRLPVKAVEKMKKEARKGKMSFSELLRQKALQAK